MGGEIAVRVLLDTHAFVWWLADSTRLSAPALETIADGENSIAVSAASAWEIATKYRLGKVAEGKVAAFNVASSIASQGFEELSISVVDAERAGQLPGPHRDPFDRMLIAQALAHDMIVVSSDTAFDQYGVKRLW